MKNALLARWNVKRISVAWIICWNSSKTKMIIGLPRALEISNFHISRDNAIINLISINSSRFNNNFFRYFNSFNNNFYRVMDFEQLASRDNLITYKSGFGQF